MSAYSEGIRARRQHRSDRSHNVCLSQKSCDRYFPSLAYRGFLLVDSTHVTVVPTTRVVELPLSELAATKCGGKMVTNVLALSVLCALTDIVTRSSLREAIETNVKRDFREQNAAAMEFGYDLAARLAGETAVKKGSAIPDLRCLREAVPG